MTCYFIGLFICHRTISCSLHVDVICIYSIMHNMGLITHIHQDLVYRSTSAAAALKTIDLFISQELPCAHRSSAGEGRDTFQTGLRVALRMRRAF